MERVARRHWHLGYERVRAALHQLHGAEHRALEGFNQFTAGQRFHGLTKIMLNNTVQDPTYINERLCTALFREAGVPAARVTHARVWLNAVSIPFS